MSIAALYLFFCSVCCHDPLLTLAFRHQAGILREAKSIESVVMDADQLISAANEDVPDFDDYT